MDARFDALDAKFDTKVQALEAKFDFKLDALILRLVPEQLPPPGELGAGRG